MHVLVLSDSPTNRNIEIRRLGNLTSFNPPKRWFAPLTAHSSGFRAQPSLGVDGRETGTRRLQAGAGAI